jgi:Rieske Fe-S protein
MSSDLNQAIRKVLSDEERVRAVNRSQQREFPYDRDKEAQVTRREFCTFLGLTSTAFLTGTVGFAAKTVYDSQNVVAHQPLRVEGAESMAPNSAVNFRYPTEDDPAILVRTADGNLHAFDQKCTHLLCPVFYDKESGHFECPCHEAGFEATTGAVLYGPPKRPLNRIALEIREGQVWAVGVITGGAKNERS